MTKVITKKLSLIVHPNYLALINLEESPTAPAALTFMSLIFFLLLKQMSSRWNPGWKKTLSLINEYIQLVQSLSSKTTADKMLSKGFHNNYFVMLNTECQDLLYRNQVLASFCCIYKVQSLQ